MAQDDNMDNNTINNAGLGGADDFKNNPDDQDNPLPDMKAADQASPDEDTPFSPPGDVPNRVNSTEQSTDSNVDMHEEYDAGLDAASAVDLPVDESDDDQPEQVA